MSNNDIAPKSLASNHNSENSLKPKKSVHEPPKSIAIGRGGAGNILSPSNSKRSTGSKKSGKAGGKKKAKSEGGPVSYTHLDVYKRQEQDSA